MMKGMVWSKLDAAMKKMDPEAILGMLPMKLPKTHQITMENGMYMPGIARYPVDQWIDENRPVMTKLMWCMMVRTIADSDRENLSDAVHKLDEQLKKGVQTTLWRWVASR